MFLLESHKYVSTMFNRNIRFLKVSKTRGPFLETPDNFPAPKTILGAQYSRIAV